MRIRMTEERSDRLRRLMQKIDEPTKAGAIDTAMKHYLSDYLNKQRVADELSTDMIEELSTAQLPLDRETSVGSGDD